MTWNIPLPSEATVCAGVEIVSGPVRYVAVRDSVISEVECVCLDSVAPHRRWVWEALSPLLPMPLRGWLARWNLVEWSLQWPWR